VRRLKKNEIEKWDIGKLNKKEVKEEFIREVTDIQNTHLEEVEDIHEMWNKAKKGINEEAGKIIGKEERPQRNSWFDEECQILLEDKKRFYNKMINRNAKQDEEECKDKRREAHEIFRQKKKEYLLNQHFRKWLIITMK